MEHSNELIESAAKHAIENADERQTNATAIYSMDRSTPRWAIGVALAYNFSTTLVFLTVATAPLFLLSMVAVDGQARFAPIVVAGLFIPILGTLLIDYAYLWSMRGVRDMRTAVSERSFGILGLASATILTFVQPLFLIPIGFSAAIAIFILEFLRRFDRNEGAWDFKKEEATALLSGRDDFGFKLATTERQEHALSLSVHRFGVTLAGLTAFALGSWLVTSSVLTLESVAALSFISMLVVDMILRAARSYSFAEYHRTARDTLVRSHNFQTVGDESSAIELDRLRIGALTVTDSTGKRLLDNINLDVSPGAIVQITGASGEGKTLLLKALTDPFSIENCEIQGQVEFGGLNLWDRKAELQSIPAVRVDACPSILPGSTLDNITCFQPDIAAERARSFLRSIVYSQEILDQMSSPDVQATHLPMMQQKVLGLVRGFILSPQVLLLDCPEAFLADRQIGKIVEIIQSQARLGRITIMVTENRALMEACDHVLVLQGGRVVDYGDGAEIRARHGSGWRRFTGLRQLDTEDALHSWLRSQFIRNGDEANRRRVCRLGSNILAHFCLTAGSDGTGNITFECKQRAGAIELRVSDDLEPISTIQFEQARQQAEDTSMGAQLSPLAKIIKEGRNIKTDSRFGARELFLEMPTYDPRKAKPDSTS